VAADHRSALPRVPGIPWWGALIVACTAAAIGFAYDAGTGDKTLSAAFATCYVLGCLLAVLAVRQSGVFTAVIQPPLILFATVPFAYFVFHGSTFTGIKDTLINCGYPLIERFPLMFFTTATVLAIGAARWYLGASARRAAPHDAESVTATETDDGLLAAAAATLAATGAARRTRRTTAPRPSRAAGAAAATAEDVPRPPRRTRTAAAPSQRSPAAAGASAASGAAAEAGPRRTRPTRPPVTEAFDPVPSRPRRRNAPPVEAPPVEPRRRPRAAEPRERRPLPPHDRRDSPERPERRDRPQRYDRPEPHERTDRAERPQRRPVAADHQPYERPPTGRPTGSNANNGTHHPVSRVRYRGADDAEPGAEHRSTPRRSRHSQPDSWE
jgi:hypothetical protein